jgi:putative endonuclease
MRDPAMAGDININQMHYVYLLQNLTKKNIYIGSSSNLKNRLYYHNHNKVKSTKNKGNYRLIYYEAYLSKKDAIIRERNLKKQHRQKDFLLKNLANSLK